MKRPIMDLSVLACLLLASASAHAQLVWETTEVKFELEDRQTPIVARFAFSNQGANPVSVFSVDLPPDVKVEGLSQRAYRPGENGVISATFDYSKLEGEQTRVLKLRTSDQPARPVELSIVAKLPAKPKPQPPLKFTPRLAAWKLGQEAKPQTVVVEVTQDRPLVISGVKLMGQHLMKPKPVEGEAAGKPQPPDAISAKLDKPEQLVSAELQELEKGRRYELTLTPRSTAAAGSVRWVLVDEKGQPLMGTGWVTAVISPPQPQRAKPATPDATEQASPESAKPSK